MKPIVEAGPALTVDQVRRYSRHLIIPDVAMDGQRRLMAAKVLCVGAGGLGSPALMYLAAAGVGTLGIVEFDVVDESNLQRQIIHGQSDVGKSKAQSAAESIAGPCYRCLYPEPPPPGMVPSCAEGGVLGVLCASIGSIQVTEAIKLITGIGESLIGELMIYDALEMTYRKVRIRKDPQCVLCGPNATQRELLDDYEGFCGAISTAATAAIAGSTISVEQLKSKMDHKDNF
ncbi:MAG: hypothetical protein EBT44_03805, partial [Actinobacteria bacterium]|nr:hypothetical protein [Candidatus Fonsibacter lacus]